MALECPDGTKLLLDTSSGNSALRSAAAVGFELKEFEDVLLSHDHPDHMGGIDFIEFNRALSGNSMVRCGYTRRMRLWKA